MTQARTLSALLPATQDQAEAGVNNEAYGTPLRGKQALEALSPGWTYTAAVDISNGGAGDLTEYNFEGLPAGISELNLFLNDVQIEAVLGLRVCLRVGYGSGPVTYVDTLYQGHRFSEASTSPMSTEWQIGFVDANGVAVVRKGVGNRWHLHMQNGGDKTAGYVDVGAPLTAIQITTNNAPTTTLLSGLAALRYR